jgi:hypothetical protein
MTQPVRLPHFIVVGAMKCGTTTLRQLLRRHPRIFMPPREIFFFAIDDLEQHAGALTSEDGRWRVHDFDRDRDEYLRWYARFFDEAAPGQILGEGSTTYMPSVKAPARIAELLPDARLIFMLRDPVERTYSQYWHLVRAGATAESFESLLRRAPATVLQRSCYKAQIERYLSLFPREQLKFVIFEDFIRHGHRTASDVVRFVGADGGLPEDVEEQPRNAARMPKSMTIQLLRNRWLPPRGARDRFAELGRPIGKPAGARGGHSVADWLFRKINPLRPGRPPAMHPDTRAFLTKLLERENRGLSEMIGIDVERYWYHSGPAGS